MLNKVKRTISELFLISVAKQIGKKLFKEDKNMDKKHWWQSKTIWSGIITILITVYNTIRPLLSENFGINLPEIPSVVYTILGALGIYGRVVANQKIG
ncbi:MAG: hypothetical protein ACK4WJ_06340 [Endomicrobiia bacterium]